MKLYFQTEIFYGYDFFPASTGKLLVAAVFHDRPCVAFFVNLDSKTDLARKISFRENYSIRIFLMCTTKSEHKKSTENHCLVLSSPAILKIEIHPTDHD